MSVEMSVGCSEDRGSVGVLGSGGAVGVGRRSWASFPKVKEATKTVQCRRYSLGWKSLWGKSGCVPTSLGLNVAFFGGLNSGPHAC
jgi:hypothetical protein